MDHFDEMRSQAMISLLLAQPVRMGQWYSRAFFDGDYSISQRTSILTTLGLGARELAGFKDDGEDVEKTKTDPADAIPSKRLPEQLHRIYCEQTPNTTTTPVHGLAKKLERMMIQPMAVDAAETLAGPDALKVRKLSSRTGGVEKNKPRKKPIKNDLAKVVAEGFFYPLIGGWWIQLKALYVFLHHRSTTPNPGFTDFQKANGLVCSMDSGNKNPVFFSPMLLPMYIKTLSIILHASGPSTISLPQMTSEFWDSLLSLRSHRSRGHSSAAFAASSNTNTSNTSNESTVLESLLFAFLTILEVNEDKQRLGVEQARELLETQTWARSVFQETGGTAPNDDEVKMLAASVLIRINEIVENYPYRLGGR